MMLSLIEGFIPQLKKAIQIGESQELTAPKNEIRNIVIAGLGGSGIGANIVESIIGNELKVPFIITKNYDLPNFVDENTLFIASSFSGNTEETLAVVEKAMLRNPKIAFITAGGKLLELAKEKGFDYVQIPNEAPCPRAFLAYSFVQLLYVLKNYKMVSDAFVNDLHKSVSLLISEENNLKIVAKKLAESFFEKMPFVYSDGKFAAVVTRLQQQINENSKQLLHHNILPEMNHNELVGWEGNAAQYRNNAVALVKSSFDNERVRVRMGICEPIWKAKAHNVIDILPLGESFVEQSLYLIYMFDWASWYLSELNKVDAFAIDVIIKLKNELAKV